MRVCNGIVTLLVILFPTVTLASITGTISGIVTDPSGAVVAKVEVTAVDSATGVEHTVRTNSAGFYSFPDLPVGTYDIVIKQSGFKEFRQTGLVIHANSEFRVDAKLEVGAAGQSVTVSASAVQVETTSTQMGEVITGSSITAMPLNGRSYTDLMALQPGVAPVNTGEYSAFPPSGELNPEICRSVDSANLQTDLWSMAETSKRKVRWELRLFPTSILLQNFAS